MPNDPQKNDPSTPVAQSVEQRIPNPQVAGSSPSRRDLATTQNGRGGTGTPGGGEPPVALGKHDHHGGFIFKSGEGYWVRVLTVVALNAICLAAAGWSYKQLGAITLPTDHWQATLRATDASLTPGTPINLVTTKLSGDGSEMVIGSGKSGEPSTGPAGEPIVRLDAIELNSGRSVAEAQAIRNSSNNSTAAPIPVAVINPVPVFPLFYLQAGFAAAIAALGVFLSYLYVGRKPSSVEFLIATDSEMRKVNWSTRRAIMGSTWVVIAACILIAGTLFVIDFGFSSFFQAIDILRTK